MMAFERLYHSLTNGKGTLNFLGRCHFNLIWFFYFFNKVIIPLALAEYELTIPNSALDASAELVISTHINRGRLCVLLCPISKLKNKMFYWFFSFFQALRRILPVSLNGWIRCLNSWLFWITHSWGRRSRRNKRRGAVCSEHNVIFRSADGDHIWL